MSYSQNAPDWYASLAKPSFAPPAEIFGPVWAFLYAIIFITFAIVFWQVAKKIFPRKVAVPFILNLIFNFAFSPIAFGLQNNLLASVDVVLVWATLIWAIVAIWRYSKIIAAAQIPYFLWVSFASVLQITITVLNF
ncbi:MAG: TspO/MBR family protein [Patescibacteria group bacterium]